MDQQTPEYFEEHAVHTARVVSAAAYFDDALAIFLSEVLELSELQENALLRPMTTRAKLDLIGRLAKQNLKPKSKKALRPYLKDARAALDERNALIHGVPAQIDGKFAFVSWVGKNKLDPKPDPWPIERVFKLAAEFIALWDAVEGLYLSFGIDPSERAADSLGRD